MFVKWSKTASLVKSFLTTKNESSHKVDTAAVTDIPTLIEVLEQMMDTKTVITRDHPLNVRFGPVSEDINWTNITNAIQGYTIQVKVFKGTCYEFDYDVLQSIKLADETFIDVMITKLGA